MQSDTRYTLRRNDHVGKDVPLSSLSLVTPPELMQVLEASLPDRVILQS